MRNERFARHVAAFAFFASAIVAAGAAPPPNPDPVLHEWFESQHSVAGAWCCDVADGFILSRADAA